MTPYLRALGFTQQAHEDVEVILPPLCHVPAGTFVMGRDEDARVNAESAAPQHMNSVGAFEIAAYPVTLAEYALAVRAGAVPPPRSQEDVRWIFALTPPPDGEHLLDYAVTEITWDDAVGYCAWLSRVTGEAWRLPSEAEWEKAARGTDGRVYPWGNTWDEKRASTDWDEEGPKPVGAYAQAGDASPYGCHEMVGGVWEWCSGGYQPYPIADAISEAADAPFRMLHGGSWDESPEFAKTTCRAKADPQAHSYDFGFRLVRGALVKDLASLT